MSKKIKQMSYLSMIIFVIGSTIGAGIFIKNHNISQLSHGEFAPVLATWGVAIVGVMALALALIEVSSAQKSDRGTLEWTKLFTPKWFHKSATNFTKYIFVPLTLFTAPLYVVSSLHSTGLEIKHGIISLIISFAIFLWFMIINLISFRFSEVSQWIYTGIQVLPLIILPIIAFLNPLGSEEILNKNVQPSKGINGLNPWISLIAGVSAIAFAFDGFYTITSMKEKTEGTKKMGAGLVLGVTCVALVYLFLTLAFNIGSTDGTHNGIKWVASKPIFIKVMNVFIAIGIISVVNGYSMGFPRQLRGLAEGGEAKEISWLHKVMFKKRFIAHHKRQLEIAGWTYILLITSFLFLSLGLIGVYAYKINENMNFGNVGTLYTFADTLVNFNSLLMFVIITTTTLGAIINRKTKRVEVVKTKTFVASAYIAIFIFYAAGSFMIVASFLDMFNLTGELSKQEVASTIIKFIVFVVIITTSIVPALTIHALEKIKTCKMQKVMQKN